MKTLHDFDFSYKNVLVRCDLNVPMKDSKITDDNRIRESLATLQYLIDQQAKVIVFSHLGRVKTEEDKKGKSLEPVAKVLSELLGKDVLFCFETRGDTLEAMVESMDPGDVLLVENTRFEDVDGNKESGNDPELGAYWASLGDYFVNDAFGTCHRAHASNVGIASYLPSACGFLVEKELEVLGGAIRDPKRPFVVILGGAKVHDKIGLIEHLLTIADRIIIGGGMSFTFLKAQGYEIGKSLLDEESLDFCDRILAEASQKLVLPIDCVVTTEVVSGSPSRVVSVSEIGEDEIGVDVGPETIQIYQDVLKDAKTIIMNGPMGVFEIPDFAKGTQALFELMAKSDAITIVGGGDSGSAAKNMGFSGKFTRISTGGGASLELLEGKVLPGIEVLDRKRV